MVRIFVNIGDIPTMVMDLLSEASAGELKRKVQEGMGCISGRVLQDNDLVMHCEVNGGSRVHLMKRLRGGGASKKKEGRKEGERKKRDKENKVERKKMERKTTEASRQRRSDNRSAAGTPRSRN